MSTLEIVLVTAASTLAVNYMIQKLVKSWQDKTKRARIVALSTALYEEVEQIAELVEVDLTYMTTRDMSWILAFGQGRPEAKERLMDVVNRILANTEIYSNNAPEILSLPDYLPNAVSKYYSRLPPWGARVERSVENIDASGIDSAIDELLAMSEALKHDLRKGFIQT